MYQNRDIAFATMHGKERVVAPAFSEALGARVIVAMVDTDTFGTFAGEVPRLGTPLETAFAKAEQGMQVTQLPLGIASEGTVGPHPVSPLITLATELMVFVDHEKGLRISATHQTTEVLAATFKAGPKTELETFLARADFPQHALIVRVEAAHGIRAIKGLRDYAHLRDAIAELAQESSDGLVTIEHDFRAHMSPSRMRAIAVCAEKLAARISSTCPHCGTPGWGITAHLPGLVCSSCRSEIPHLIAADVYSCASCQHTETVSRGKTEAEPRWCDWCNP